MLRFKYTKYLVPLKNKNDSLTLTYSMFVQEDPQSYDFSQDTNFENKFKLIDNYKDFLKTLEESKSINTKFYLSTVQNNKLYMFQSDSEFEEIYGFLIYEFENDFMKDLFIKIIGSDDENLKLFTSTISNDFNIIMPINAFRVILEYNNILANNGKPYNIFKIKQKKGKIRKIIAPEENLKGALREMNTQFQKMYDGINADFQVAYKVGKNVKTNAALHTSNKYIFNIDLKHFYESCSRELVEKYVQRIFNCTNQPKIYTDLFLDAILLDDALFVGSPVSGCLANRVIAKPVEYMRAICKKYNIEFSVYADDMTFSSNKYLNKSFVYGIFNAAFQQYEMSSNFRLNKKKSIGASNHKRRITGVVINNEDKMTVPRNYYRNLRVAIHKLSIGETDGININEIRGRLAYAIMIDDTGKFYNYLTKFPETIKLYKLCSEATLEKAQKKFEGGV